MGAIRSPLSADEIGDASVLVGFTTQIHRQSRSVCHPREIDPGVRVARVPPPGQQQLFSYCIECFGC